MVTYGDVSHLCATVHGEADVGTFQRRRIVRAVACHRNYLIYIHTSAHASTRQHTSAFVSILFSAGASLVPSPVIATI
jgi:hypothetical protein